jgi:hypothetical protein
MQFNAIAGGDRPRDGVRGLGVSDVLEIDLEPSQLPWLLDEPEAMRDRIGEQLQQATAAALASPSSDTQPVEEREYELRLLGMMRARLPKHIDHVPIAFVGPSGMVEDAVRGAVRRAADALSQLAAGNLRSGIDAGARLDETAVAAAKWVETLQNCQAVVGFNFDPGANPGAAW